MTRVRDGYEKERKINNRTDNNNNVKVVERQRIHLCEATSRGAGIT